MFACLILIVVATWLRDLSVEFVFLSKISCQAATMFHQVVDFDNSRALNSLGLGVAAVEKGAPANARQSRNRISDTAYHAGNHCA
jgi:hypothetical protein